MSEMRCEKHNIDMECMGGRSAHPSNWYCPACDEIEELKQRIAELEAKIDAVVEYKVIIEKALQLASKALAAIEALQPASGGE